MNNSTAFKQLSTEPTEQLQSLEKTDQKLDWKRQNEDINVAVTDGKNLPTFMQTTPSDSNGSESEEAR